MVSESLLHRVDAIDREVIRASLIGIVQEIQNSLFRTGFSTIIRESQDASCALMDSNGFVIAQHVVLPLHIGAFPACTAAIISEYSVDLAPGDAFLINHPYHGGSPHAPDMAVITPIFFDHDLIGFCGSIAHKSDIGGPVPGSCSGQAREVFNEGLQLPAVRCQRNYMPFGDIERIIAANSRTPDLVLGDIRGQIGAARLGEARLIQLIQKFGKLQSLQHFNKILELSEARIRASLLDWTDGRFSAERFVDDDGITLDLPVRIHVEVTKTKNRIHFDFSKSADQTDGPANIRPPLVQAACAYCLISLTDPQTDINSGILAAIDITTRPGSILNPHYPAPVNTYNPTVHAVVDAIFAALANIVPTRARADGCGSRSIILGGRNTYGGKGYVQYEIIGGGAGGRMAKDGASGTTVNQSNARIASIEVIESEFPTRVLCFELLRDSGGPGTFRGGLGVRREYLNLQDARFSIRSTKHIIAPQGISGGSQGGTGDILINPGTDKERRLPTRYADYPLKAGDVFRLDAPGGGGFGCPFERDIGSVLEDVIQGYVSVEMAAAHYGVILYKSGYEWRVDHAATIAYRTIKDGK
ncbi:MAG: hypothetical protein B7Z77_07585 [Acidocella sp. 20-58-15]|nr:MAG: hypothetical protein B7Z77_07585 [Acidocella sp. 20-58-15]